MEVVVRVTPSELEEMEMATQELREAVISDLEDSRDYPGFNVKVEVIVES